MRKLLFFSNNKILMSLGAVAMACLSFASCEKEGKELHFVISTERYGSSAKVMVDGVSSSWMTGDSIWVNDVKGVVSTSGGDTVLDISVDSREGVFYAAYPSSIALSCTDGGLLSVSLPQAYQYKEDATTGKQLLEMPMVAMTRDETLVFKHLTGSLIIEISPANADVVLDYIMVRSSTSPLSGPGTVDMTSSIPQVDFAQNPDTSHMVVMFFDESPVTILSSAVSAKRIMIPIAPTTGDNHRFTVTVCAHQMNSQEVFYFFNDKSRVGNMSRNVLVTAPVSVVRKTAPFVGNGTVNDPYLVQNREDYKHFLTCVSRVVGNVPSAYMKMTNDIDFQNMAIQSATGGFGGTFDGNGKHVRNVEAVACHSSVYDANLMSVFPPLSAGTLKNFGVENVRLNNLGADVYSQKDVFAGGVVSLIKLQGNNVALQNVSVLNVTSVSSFDFGGRVCIGGVIGRLESRTGGDSVEMLNCRFSQAENAQLNIDIRGCASLSFGGLFAVASGIKDTIGVCQVDYGGTESRPGVSISAGVYTSYVGALFGALMYSTLSFNVSNWTVKGYLHFMGSSTTYVHKLVGYATTTTSFPGVNCSNLVFRCNNIYLY